MNSKLILVVEDEPKLANLLKEYLQNAGFGFHLLARGDEVVERVRTNPPDLILLDLMLPGQDGISICRGIREFSSVPIIMLTARVEEVDRLLGLDVGADDYVCKPYSPREVLARIQAVFRRTDGTVGVQSGGRGLYLDADSQKVSLNGKELDLTVTEYRLLSVMAAKPGRVFSRDRLMDCLIDEGLSATDRAIDSHIKNLRKKLAAISAEREWIVSVYGAGYRLEP